VEYGCPEVCGKEKEVTPVKMRFICNCCDKIFHETLAPEEEASEDIEFLTDTGAQDIILEDAGNSDVLVSSTCGECSRALGLGSEDDLVFFRNPLIH
jgi:hypothetical protein